METGAQPLPVSPRPWRKITVAEWRERSEGGREMMGPNVRVVVGDLGAGGSV